MPTLFLFVIGVMAGALNAVAGGGSFLGLPALLYAGVSPVSANATTTFAMWPGSLASAVAYRRDIIVRRQTLVPLGVASVAGGLAGGLLLMRTSDLGFMRLLPWLMLLATVAFTFAGRLTARLGRGRPHELAPWALLLQLVDRHLRRVLRRRHRHHDAGRDVGGRHDEHPRDERLKVLLAVAINGVALLEFFLHGAVDWGPGLVMAAGGIAGGYLGARLRGGCPRSACGCS